MVFLCQRGVVSCFHPINFEKGARSMADYDNKNGRSLHTISTQRLILQGKINSDGTDMKVTCVMDETKDGSQWLRYTKSWCLVSK